MIGAASKRPFVGHLVQQAGMVATGNGRLKGIAEKRPFVGPLVARYGRVA